MGDGGFGEEGRPPHPSSSPHPFDTASALNLRSIQMPKNYHDLIQKWAGTITDLNRHIKHGEGAKGPPNEGPFLNLHTDEKKVDMVVKGLKKKLEKFLVEIWKFLKLWIV